MWVVGCCGVVALLWKVDKFSPCRPCVGSMSSFTSTTTAHFPPQGIVDLKEKQQPVCETAPPFHADYAFTRAVVDVSALKSKLLSLPPELWEDEKQQEGNVKLHRPAHDAWGIKKIVFTFCDDFLLKVFDLPWSQAEEWRRHLLPIYAAVGVDESKVVRSLLASMPPGMSIPVHHDTGYWVKHTHRCVSTPPLDAGPAAL